MFINTQFNGISKYSGLNHLLVVLFPGFLLWERDQFPQLTEGSGKFPKFL